MIDYKWQARFEAKWKMAENGCWSWIGAKLPAGYGIIKIPNCRKFEYAHRLSWRIFRGEIPEGLYVLHTCDNPNCVNPEHLMLGNQKENSRQMVARDRHLYGERNTESKLTEHIVENIHRMYSKGYAQSRIAIIYGIHQMTVSKIIRGERWAHVKRRLEESPTV